MKKEAKALLKSKFSGVQLSEARQEAIASRAAAKATTTEELEAALDALNEAYPFADIAKEDDRLRSLEAEVKKKAEPVTPPVDPVVEEEGKDTPAWAKALVESNKSLAEEIKSIKAEKATTTRKDQAIARLNLSNLDEEIRNSVLEDIEDRSFTDDDHFDKYIDRQSKLLGTAIQNATDSQFGNDTPTNGVRTQATKVVEASSKELDALMENFKI